MNRPETDPSRIESLLHEALCRPAAERKAFLDTTCAGEPALRREVESLLEHAGDADRLFDSSNYEWTSIPSIRESLEGHAAAEAGETVGQYRLIERVGAGGMGDVYRAARADDEFEQTVAVKLIGRGLDTDDILARFRLERQVLATLNHPNIARLLDGGTTAGDRPYLVMEYVDGQRIDEYCDAARLTVRQRVELFRVVCDAVQFAHRNLVVHRDIKPGNIFVERRNGEATVKLLDFGIAKVLAGDGAEDQAERTLETGRRLTLAYASPEQVRGEPVTTATDVYSLGAVLYRLLTGRLPYDADPSVAADLEDAIRRQDPRKPGVAVMSPDGEASARDAARAIAERRSTDSARLRRELSGDLETILLTALHKEPERRYPTAAALSEDLRRWLAGLPIAARPDSAGYRFGKFVRRHPAGVAAGVAVTLALVAATAVSSLMFAQARSAEALAGQRTRTALTINSYLTDLLTSVDPEVAQGRDVSVFREALDETSRRILAELDDAPLVASQLHHTIGEAYHSIGEYDRAALHLEQAADLQEANGLPAAERVQTLLALGLCRVEVNDFDEAEDAYTRALRLLGDAPPASRETRGLILARLGHLESTRGNFDEAEAYLRDGLALLRRSEAGARRLAFALEKLGHVLVNRRRTQEAAPLLEEAAGLLRGTLGELHPRLATLETELGWCARRSGDPETALGHYEEALRIRRAIFDPDHYHIGNSLLGLAAVLEDLGRYEEAERRYLEAIDVLVESVGRSHTETGTACNNLGGLYRKMGRPEAALERLNAAAEIYAEVRGPDDFFVSFPRAQAALCLLELRRYGEALAAAEDCLRLRRGRIPERSTEIQSVRAVRGAALTGLGRFEEAARVLLESYELMEPELPPDSLPLTRTSRYLVELYEAWERPDEAAAWRERLDGAPPGGS